MNIPDEIRWRNVGDEVERAAGEKIYWSVTTSTQDSVVHDRNSLSWTALPVATRTALCKHAIAKHILNSQKHALIDILEPMIPPAMGYVCLSTCNQRW